MQQDIVKMVDEIVRLKQQRAELLEVLKEILPEYAAYNCYADEELIAQAHSAITKAEAAE